MATGAWANEDRIAEIDKEIARYTQSRQQIQFRAQGQIDLLQNFIRALQREKAVLLAEKAEAEKEEKE